MTDQPASIPPVTEAIDTPHVPKAWPWVVGLITAGVLLATWPHLINFIQTGDATYIADGDGLLYHAWSRDSLNHGSWSMTDAVHPTSGPMMHAWLLFVPEALLAHVCGGSVAALGIVWRAVGGALLAGSLYLFLRPLVASPARAAGLAAFLLFDTGLEFGQIFRRDPEILLGLLRRSPGILTHVPTFMAHLRAPTPLLAYAFLIIHFYYFKQARENASRRNIVLAGISLGLLFHVYFYFATMAFPALFLMALFDRAHRSAYIRIFVLGLIVAAPALVAGALIKQSTPPDWLLRTHKFAPVPRFSLQGLLLPKVLIAFWVISAYWVFRKRREFAYLWVCTGVALALCSHNFVTGLDIENFHWIYAYGVTFSVLQAVLLYKEIGPWRGWKFVLILGLVLQISAGFVLRTIETVRSPETNLYRGMADDWRNEKFDIAPSVVVAGPPELLLLLAATTEIAPLYCRLVEFSSLATDVEYDERLVLNAILTGRPKGETINFGEAASEASKMRRKALWTAIAADLPSYVARYDVTAIIRAAQADDPLVASLFPEVSHGQKWTLQRRTAASIAK